MNENTKSIIVCGVVGALFFSLVASFIGYGMGEEKERSRILPSCNASSHNVKVGPYVCVQTVSYDWENLDEVKGE